MQQPPGQLILTLLLVSPFLALSMCILGECTKPVAHHGVVYHSGPTEDVTQGGLTAHPSPRTIALTRWASAAKRNVFTRVGLRSRIGASRSETSGALLGESEFHKIGKGLTRPLARALVAKDSTVLFELFRMPAAAADRLAGFDEERFDEFRLADLLPLLSCPSEHFVAKLRDEYDAQTGGLKVQFEVVRAPAGNVDGPPATYVLAYTFPVRAASGQAESGKDLAIVPSLGIARHERHFWDPDELLKTVPKGTRVCIGALLDRYVNALKQGDPDTFVSCFSEKFAFTSSYAECANKLNWRWLQAKWQMMWCPLRPAGTGPGALRITPHAFSPQGPDTVTADCTYESAGSRLFYSQRLVDPHSKWTFAREDGEWKILSYRAKCGPATFGMDFRRTGNGKREVPG